MKNVQYLDKVIDCFRRNDKELQLLHFGYRWNECTDNDEDMKALPFLVGMLVEVMRKSNHGVETVQINSAFLDAMGNISTIIFCETIGALKSLKNVDIYGGSGTLKNDIQEEDEVVRVDSLALTRLLTNANKDLLTLSIQEISLTCATTDGHNSGNMLFFDSLSKLQSLQEIEIVDVNFIPSNSLQKNKQSLTLDSLLQAVTKIKTLESVRIESCGNGDNRGKSMTSKSERTTRSSLRSCDLSTNTLSLLCPSLPNLNNISLNDLGLDDTHISAFMKGFMKTISDNGGSDNVKEEANKKSCLKGIDFSYNKISSDGCEALAIALRKTTQQNSDLSYLYLHYNAINDSGIIALTNALKSNRIKCTLQCLDITGNYRIGDRGYQSILDMLEHNFMIDNIITNADYEIKSNIESSLKQNRIQRRRRNKKKSKRNKSNKHHDRYESTAIASKSTAVDNEHSMGNMKKQKSVTINNQCLIRNLAKQQRTQNPKLTAAMLSGLARIDKKTKNSNTSRSEKKIKLKPIFKSKQLMSSTAEELQENKLRADQENQLNKLQTSMLDQGEWNTIKPKAATDSNALNSNEMKQTTMKKSIQRGARRHGTLTKLEDSNDDQTPFSSLSFTDNKPFKHASYVTSAASTSIKAGSRPFLV